LITTNFNVLKYIKKIFKISIQCNFYAQQKITQEKLVKNLDSTKYTHGTYSCGITLTWCGLIIA